MGKRRGFSSLFTGRMKTKKRGEYESPPRLEINGQRSSRSDRLHRRNEADVRAADGTLRACHDDRGAGCGSAAIFLRAVVAGAGTAWDFDLFGDRFVAWNLLLHCLIHAAAFRAAADPDLFGDSVGVASLHLAGLRAEAGSSGRHAKHGAAGGKAEGNGDEGDEKKEVFHVDDIS
jgi:hypothetical protein